MTCRATIKNGMLVPHEPINLPEGAVVELGFEIVPSETPAKGSLAALAQLNIEWAGDSEELDRLLDEVRQARQDDLNTFGIKQVDDRYSDVDL